MNEKIPVFDIGDTLLPSEKMINETIKDHVAGAPDMDIYQYNIYRPAEIRNFLELNGLEVDAEEITKSYQEKVKIHLEENKLFELFEKINQENGFVGFISDNSLELKYFWQDMLRERGLNPRIIVSEEVGAEKPDLQIFERFLNLSEYDNPEKYVYFGNNVEKDSAAEDTGMTFVWVSEHETGEESFVGPEISEFNQKNVEKMLEKVENQ